MTVFMAQKLAKPADFLRVRFRELSKAAGISQSELCRRLTKRTGMLWRESRLSKILNGNIAWDVDDLVLMAEEAGVSLVELMRQPGREYVGDLTPSEHKVLRLARENAGLLPTLVHVAELADRSKPLSYRAQMKARHAATTARMKASKD